MMTFNANKFNHHGAMLLLQQTVTLFRNYKAEAHFDIL